MLQLNIDQSSGRSTYNTCKRLDAYVLCAREENTVAVFIDFQSAYDMLWHNGLFVKLKKMGITEKPVTYI